MLDIKESEAMPHEDVRTATAEVRDLVGSELTAYLVDFDDTIELGKRLEKEEVAHPRLRLVLELAGLFRAANAVSRFRAWLREIDIEVDKRRDCPARLIRDSSDSELRVHLTDAAVRYLRTV